tara:strand:- start:83 stop:313 length:231 start_codon:yes stop_codon:yes gene_type:complete
MQKVINTLAACTFVLALANTAVIVFAVTRGPSMAKEYISNLKLELAKTILDQVPVPEIPEMPKLPTSTGPAIPGLK